MMTYSYARKLNQTRVAWEQNPEHAEMLEKVEKYLEMEGRLARLSSQKDDTAIFLSKLKKFMPLVQDGITEYNAWANGKKGKFAKAVVSYFDFLSSTLDQAKRLLSGSNAFMQWNNLVDIGMAAHRGLQRLKGAGFPMLQKILSNFPTKVIVAKDGTEELVVEMMDYVKKEMMPLANWGDEDDAKSLKTMRSIVIVLQKGIEDLQKTTEQTFMSVMDDIVGYCNDIDDGLSDVRGDNTLYTIPSKLLDLVDACKDAAANGRDDYEAQDDLRKDQESWEEDHPGETYKGPRPADVYEYQSQVDNVKNLLQQIHGGVQGVISVADDRINYLNEAQATIQDLLQTVVESLRDEPKDEQDERVFWMRQVKSILLKAPKEQMSLF